MSLDLTVLNRPQLEAVLHDQGPMLVLAGAGSGKTRVITYRIARLVRDGIRPENILAVTFTNKAAAEMRDRASELIGRGSKKRLTICTFHSLGHRMLRECANAAALSSHFSIYDQGEQIGTIRRIFRDIKIDDRKFDAKKILSMISNLKNKNISADDAPINDEDDYTLMTKEVFGRYQAHLRREQAVDFDDLLLRPANLLHDRADVRQLYRDRFHYVLVDEYQDTNPIQFRLLTELCDPDGNLVVVGDDDQAIYGFRGAEVEHILHFQNHFPGAKEIALEQNYRSTSAILNAANAVISHNLKRKAKSLWTSLGEGDPVELHALTDEDDEAKFVASQALMAIDKGTKAENIAVLYRSNIQSRPIEEALRFEHIPYRVIGGMEYFERKEVKDALCYLRVAENPDDEHSMRRIINYPARGVGEVALERLVASAKERGCSLSAAIADPPPEVKNAARKALQEMAGHLLIARQGFAAASRAEDYAKTATALFEALELREAIYDEFENLAVAARKIENIEHLVRSLEQFAANEPEQTLSRFLGQLSLETPEQEQEDQTNTGVTLITIHAAKGLEWPLVFLVGMEEELLPHKRTIEDASGDIGEERRLCYVGITRARERLFLSRATQRRKYGTIVPRTASRFLDEIGEGVVRRSGEPAPLDDDKADKIANDFFAKMRSKLEY